MNVDTMRRIDRWAGVPLCWVVGWLLRLLPGRTGDRPRRILFIELSEMGSTILADPAMRRAAAAFGAELHFVIFKSNVGSLAFLDTVPHANIFTLDARGFPSLVLDTLRFLVWCRRRRIDTAIDLELFSRFTALLSAASGAGRRVGFHRFHNEGLYRGETLTHKVAYNPHIHIAKNFLALIHALEAPVPEEPFSKRHIADSELIVPRRVFSDEAKATMAARVAAACPAFGPGRRIVLFNPNASELLPQRRWPAENFRALAAMILERWPDALILVTGAPSEAAEAEALRTAIGTTRAVNFAGKVALAELPLLYAISTVMVTNDSGPAHFAAVTDLPTIVLFGPETPALYHSLGDTRPVFAGLACSPCVSAANHRKTACRDPVCLKAITPARVLAEVSAVLGEPAAGKAMANALGGRA